MNRVLSAEGLQELLIANAPRIKVTPTKKRNALKKAIKHWQDDVLHWLESGYKIVKGDYSMKWCDGEAVKIGSGACALCTLFLIQKPHESLCTGCPLDTNEQSCGREKSAYRKFANKPNIANAKYMIKVMEDILNGS